LGALVVTTDVDRALERLAELRARLRAGVPGTYEGIGDEEYHGDPVEAGSLSSTEVRKLIDTPRRFYAYKFGGARPQTAAQLRGIAAHARVLGSGPRIVVLGEDEGSDALTDAKGKPTTSRNARSVQEWCEEQEALGRLVLTPTERDTIEGMATALREHPDAGALFDPARGGNRPTSSPSPPSTGRRSATGSTRCGGRAAGTSPASNRGSGPTTRATSPICQRSDARSGRPPRGRNDRQ
jgi:hypothetical protein